MKLLGLSIGGYVRLAALKKLLPAASKTISCLEVGFGIAGISQVLAKNYDYVGLEPDTHSYEIGAAKIRDAGGVAVNSPFEEFSSNDQFSLVVAFEVIEHIEDDIAALRNWASAIEPFGILVITTPGHPERFSPFDVYAGHFRRYSPATLREALTAADLEVLHINHYGGPFSVLSEYVRSKIVPRNSEQAPPSKSDLYTSTAASGRYLQPTSIAKGFLTRLGSIPALFLAWLFPNRGNGLIALAQKRASISNAD